MSHILAALSKLTVWQHSAAKPRCWDIHQARGNIVWLTITVFLLIFCRCELLLMRNSIPTNTKPTPPTHTWKCSCARSPTYIVEFLYFSWAAVIKYGRAQVKATADWMFDGRALSLGLILRNIRWERLPVCTESEFICGSEFSAVLVSSGASK